ncbi:MAG: helix-turn-helix transcriptional regulator [Pseudomonadota bacterium]
MSELMKKPHISIKINDENYILAVSKLRSFLIIIEALGAYKQTEKSIDSELLLKELYGDKPKGATHLKGARYKEGLSQAELSKKTGIQVYNISKMENGKRAIGEKLAKKLGKVLQVSYKVFLEK